MYLSGQKTKFNSNVSRDFKEGITHGVALGLREPQGMLRYLEIRNSGRPLAPFDLQGVKGGGDWSPSLYCSDFQEAGLLCLLVSDCV